MKEGPDIAFIAALIGDPARANILTALMGGKALTASELALECGVTAQTTSAHLAKLQNGGLILQRKQGRHRYFSLAGEDVGQVLETLMGLAASRGHLRIRTGPKDPALRKARVCYNHLAGELGVSLFDALKRQGWITGDDDISLSQDGCRFIEKFGIDLEALQSKRRPLCLTCLDWSARRDHLAGSLGTAVLTRTLELGWAKRNPGSRAIAFSPSGEEAFRQTFGII